MSDDLGREGWERRWTQVLDGHATDVDRRPPNPTLLAEAADLPPGLALDAGAGHGSEALWLAVQGWRVTAVDFSATALARGRTRAERAGVSERIDWVEGDLGTWTPPPGRFDLVTCLYVHVAGSAPDMVRRLADGVAPGGTLLLVGHPAVDPETGAPTRAAGQTQVSVDDAREALDAGSWELLVAEHRPRETGGGVDTVVRARRRS
ncbi:methyltransferase family protein [Actinomycetospora succinea]|uniref:Methyltransferase family protein n=1 Tax=Actinomycetospora succinea TaxID=663603 RepID=A0A4R6UMR1_9PSEU|nr:class I SAM-dependent methyltransferase [Actinomycetospora succinea]TDQ46455.1 methyltransferase family protein [Actinomycetospora succinea]